MMINELIRQQAAVLQRYNVKLVTKRLSILSALLFGLCCETASADVKPASIFTTNAVLQQEQPVPVWGTADPNEPITVSINDDTAKSVADASGKWMVKLAPMNAGGPYTMTISGTAGDTVTLSNILVGEVWLCGGQSNMTYSVKGWSPDALTQTAIPTSADPLLHFIMIPVTIARTPQSSVGGSWQVADPSTIGNLTAVGYFFARELRKVLGVPVGIIHDNASGTPAQAWTSREALEAVPQVRHWADEETANEVNYPALLAAYNQKMAAYKAQVAAAATSEGASPPASAPGAAPVGTAPPAAVSIPRPPAPPVDNAHWREGATHLFNGMIAPLIPYAIRGVIWYQGENNVDQAYEYQTLFPTMISDWRTRWGEGDFPFLYVQISPTTRIRTDPLPKNVGGRMELREAQRLALATVPNTGMVVTTDIGDSKAAHPMRKEQVGERLALIAEAQVYGKNVEYSGPQFEGFTVEGATIRVNFTHAEGLKSVDVHDITDDGPLIASANKLVGFEIAGANGKYVNANAVIDGTSVVLSSPQVPNPVSVRYGWANYPVVNLANSAGLPASPFKADNWPWASAPQKESATVPK